MAAPSDTTEVWATVSDWDEKQHYKSRKGPLPWIKLHRRLLDSYRFQCLPLASKALAPQLWLLAAEKNGAVRVDIPYLVFRLSWSEDDLREGLKYLIENNYLSISAEDASTVLASSALIDK